jgi:ATP-dependent DNA helicase RecG
VCGRVAAVTSSRSRRGIPYCEVRLTDETGTLCARWYRQAYLARTFRPGQRLILAGKLSPYPPRELVNPEHELEEAGDTAIHTGRLVPVYPLTAGLSQRYLRRLLGELAQQSAPALRDPLPPPLRARHNLPSLAESALALHWPEDLAAAHAARRRLSFDEFFLFSLGVLRERARRGAQPGIAFAVTNPLLAAARARLPFALTAAQEAALVAILADMASGRPMQRLLQGDVGCGKTIVAFLAAAAAAGSGYQAALMAPTEILAMQHAEQAQAFLEPLGLPVLPLIGGQPEGVRRATRARLAEPTPCLAVGTHALLQGEVLFGRLGLAIVDEQHRFGVLQRAALREKATHPDLLVMSATPIPRSLALVLYGDLDLTTIAELPPGRQPVRTIWADPVERGRIAASLAERLARGEQAFVVCPVVEESAQELKAAVHTAEDYRRGPLGRFGVGLVHGRLPAAEKARVVAEFRAARLGLLVATTVVEVGVDVPRATVMVVEDADRLGLAQLHQLRGRVGRGDRPALCIVVADRQAVSEAGRARLEALVGQPDGFALAEADLRLRGPGEFFGTRQSGQDGFPAGEVVGDLQLLEEARHAADRVLAEDPGLCGLWADLREPLEARWASRLDLARIG